MTTKRVVFFLCTALLLGQPAEPGFGIAKTRVFLPRLRPPQEVLLARTVSVHVTSDSPAVTRADVDIVQTQLAAALGKWDIYKVAPEGSPGDATVTVRLVDLDAEVRDEIKMEQRYVKIGERQEWDEKKKKLEKKDIMGYRSEPVNMRVGRGSIRAAVEVAASGGRRTSDASVSYSETTKRENAPEELSSEMALKQTLVQRAAIKAIGAVTFAPDPVEALLAADSEMKAGNRLAQSGLFQQAFEEWQRPQLKDKKDRADQLHNLGVAEEAMAYGFAPHTPEHRRRLETAKENYRAALRLNPGEKYFTPPIERIEMSLQYVTTAIALLQDLQRFREKTHP